MTPRVSWSIKQSCILAFGLALLTSRPTASPQVISSELSLRVAFVFNIAKFIEWPDVASRITICAANSLPDTQAALNQLNGKSLHGKTIKINFLSAQQIHAHQLDECQLLYQEIGSDLVLNRPLPLNTVFIRDRASTSNIPSSVVLWLGADGRLNFSVNSIFLKSTNVKVSSQLLKLAKPQRE
ncbi:MAG: hypothetical protein RL497_481 [Pseudomonadota bacterium]